MGLRDIFRRKKGKLPSKIYIGTLIEMRDFTALPARYSPYSDGREQRLRKVKGGLFTVERGFMGAFVIQRYSPKKSGMINHTGIVNALHPPDAENIVNCNLEERYTLSGHHSAEWHDSFVGIVKEVPKGILPKGTLFKVNPEYIHWWQDMRYGKNEEERGQGTNTLTRSNFGIAYALLSEQEYVDFFEKTSAWNQFVNLYWGATTDTMTWQDLKEKETPMENRKAIDDNLMGGGYDLQEVTMMFRHMWELPPAILPYGGMWNSEHRYGKVFPNYYVFEGRGHNKLFKKFFERTEKGDNSDKETWVIGSSCQFVGNTDKTIELIPYVSLSRVKVEGGYGYDVSIETGSSVSSDSSQVILPLKTNNKPYIKDGQGVFTKLSPYALGWLVKMNVFQVVGYDLSIAENALKGSYYYDPDVSNRTNPSKASDENLNLAKEVQNKDYQNLFAPLRPYDVKDYRDLPVLKLVKIRP